MAMDPPPHLVFNSSNALIKRGCECRDLHLGARSRPCPAMIISAAPRYAFRPLRLRPGRPLTGAPGLRLPGPGASAASSCADSAQQCLLRSPPMSVSRGLRP